MQPYYNIFVNIVKYVIIIRIHIIRIKSMIINTETLGRTS